MRKEIYRLAEPEALTLLARAPAVHLASVTSEGVPVLRALHGVVVDGALAFHGAPAGEKMDLLGRPAVVSHEEVLAEIPSYFIDPVRACPATTYYRSVQAHGTVELVTDREARARVLARLMEKFQPEGGHAPIAADEPMYRKALDGLLVARVPLTRVDGKAKLGQNRTPTELSRVVERLWLRGEGKDPRALEAVLSANPSVPVPSFLRGPHGTRLVVAPEARHLEPALALLEGAYWNQGVAPEVLRRAHVHSDAWVVALDVEGGVVATARAVSDRAKVAWLYDVMVAPSWRARGLGDAVVKVLLAHPAVRDARTVRLQTVDAVGFYERLGFLPGTGPRRPWTRVDMALERASNPLNLL
jgi:nitroimidazol reductase NimA-like FMN-containing flavoprotein (pyridoxamine 5'-phosphate oxidase superfamily)/N-acetylglutamate synthase-like GNAT family acetyltransferase